MKLSKSLIVFVGLSLFGGVSLATNYPTIACPNLPNTNTCQLCFNGGGIYEGTSRYGIADDYINTTNSWYVGLQSENQNNVNSLTLQSSTLWSFPELKWIDDAANCGILGNNNFCATAAWYTNPQWGLYHMFAPKYTNTYLKAQWTDGLKLNSVSTGTSRNSPASVIKVDLATRKYNGAGQALGSKSSLQECFFYYPNWCGDGVLDSTYSEECDLWAQNGQPGSTCSATCKKITLTQPTCNSTYNGKQTDEDLNNKTDAELCVNGTKTITQQPSASNGRTWKWTCNGQTGTTPAQCSATKPAPVTPGTGVIKKVLASPQYVTAIGEQVTWKITLTASGGNLNLANHTIKEKLPAELEYVSYTVTTPNGVTVNAPSVTGNIITWALNGTLAQNSSIVINLVTKVKQMPPAGNTVRNVACFAKNTWEELSCDNPPINPSCNSSYHGQVVENLTWGNNLCNFGTISNFTPTTSGGVVTGWTWKCNGESGTTPAQCSATKKTTTIPGTGTIEKTLVSPQYVTATGEQITWKIVVTARNGAISNFTIIDKLPTELELAPAPYYTVLVSNGVTVNAPTVNGNTITWTTSGSLAKDKTIEIELRTKVKSMPKATVRNVACLKIGNNPELCVNPPINPSCNSSYHGQVVENLTWGNNLCNFGTISNFTPTTSGGVVIGRTWKCNGESGTTPSQCSATKPNAPQIYDLALTKKLLSTGPLKLGDLVTFRITVYNQGGSIANNIRIVDYVPTGLIPQNYTLNPTSEPLKWTPIYDPQFDSAILNIRQLFYTITNPIAPGASRSVDITFKIDPAFVGTSIRNIAEIAQDDGDDIDSTPDTDPNNDCMGNKHQIDTKCPTDEDDHDWEDITFTTDAPDLWLTKTFSDGTTGPKTYRIGDTVEYKIDFGNRGNAPATVVSLKDFVPQNLTGITSVLFRTDSNSTHSSEIEQGGYVDVYDTITLPAGASGYFIVRGIITSEWRDFRTNKACIYLNGQVVIKKDWKPACEEVVYILEKETSHLKINKTVDKIEVNIGDTVTFTLKVDNDGHTPMTNFTVTDTLPSNVRYVNGSQSSNGFWFNNAGQTLIWHNYNGILQPGQSITITFRATVESIGRHTNWVCLTHNDFPNRKEDSNSRENCDPADVVAKEKPYCGDGIRNNGERCDYRDPTKSGRGTDGCDTSCNPINDDRPYCGNGVIDSSLKETCECPKGRLSCQWRDVIFPDGHRDNNASCTYCHIPNQTTPIACFDVGNGSISINEGEMLPFYRNIEKVDEGYYTELGVDAKDAVETYEKYEREKNHSCNPADEGKMALDAMVCTFRVYNGESLQSANDYVYELKVPCFTKGTDIQGDRQNSTLISKWIEWNKNNFIKDGNANWGNTFRSYNILNNNRGFAFRSSVFVINNFGRSSSAGESVIYGAWTQKSERIGVYGEYKLSLHEVNYLQCENGYRKTQDSYNRVCDVNFSVTKPYIIQKTPAGNVENVKIDTTTVDLSKFLMYADGTPTNFSAQLGKVISTGGVYNPTKEVKDALNGFINKYSKLAVKVNSSLFGSTDVKKVPGKDIYFVNGNITIDGFRFTYDVSKTKKTETKGTNSIYDRPFTIVQTVGNTTIKGNLNHNMMLLTNGAITFDGSNNCNDAQVVKGIFYAGMDFKSANVAKNDRLNNTDRCIGGNLHIKGIAIGKGLDNVAANRRSELNQWFRSRSSQDQSATDRRNYIMNGAAVLIEYATSVFTKATMPPGAEEFTTALAVYRQ